MTVDFVIPHMGRSEMLIATIESILAQTDIDKVSRIIVVSRNPEPPTVPESPLVHVVHQPDIGSISEQRNLGVTHSNSELLAFLDADIELNTDWLAVTTNLINTLPNTVIVSAIQKVKRPDNPVEQLRTALSNVSTNTNVQFLPGRNLLIRRAHHEEIGGFPEHLETCEDYFYTDKASKLGSLYYTADTFYYHLGEDLSLSQTFKKEIWRSEYNLKSVNGRDVPLTEWPSILLPFWILLFALIALLSIFNPGVFILALVAVGIPPVLYSMRLLRHKPENLSPAFVVQFYTIYFVARTIGTVAGIRKLGTRTKHEA